MTAALSRLPAVIATVLVLTMWDATCSAVPAAEDSPPRIVTLGDSITKGVRQGVKASETFSAILQAELKKTSRPFEVINVGIGGERTDGALARLDRDVMEVRPEIVLVMYGTNDSYVDIGKSEPRLTVADYSENLRKLVRRLREAKIKPVLMTEPRWGDAAKPNGAGEHPNQRLARYVDACRNVAKELDVPLVDHFAIWQEKNDRGFDIGKWTTDECHPNPEGHAVLAASILTVLRESGLVQKNTPTK